MRSSKRVLICIIALVAAAVHVPLLSQNLDLTDTVQTIEEQLDARVGVSIHDVNSDKHWHSNGDELCAAAITVSDNTAGNLVLKAIGGPEGLTRFLRSLGDEQSQLNRWETELNDAVPGDRRDTTTPVAIAQNMEKLLFGDVLSAASRKQLTDWMRADVVADALFRAGLPADWEIADKSGAGGYGSRSLIAIIWPPANEPIIAAVYITVTDASMDQRNAAIAQIGKDIATAITNSPAN